MKPPIQISFVESKNCPAFDAAQAAYISYMPKVFESKVFELSKIRASVATKFGVPLHHVLSCGSAQFGFSVFKKTAFNAKSSDLDLAIISPKLFSELYDISLTTTDAFANNVKFDSNQAYESFLAYVSKKGMIRPDLLPACAMRTIWMAFFKNLSSTYKNDFKSISAAVYLSEKSFIYKQVPAVLATRGEPF